MSSANDKKAKGTKKNILLLAITRMGDMLQASPTIAGLKRENPQAKLTILVDREFAPICRGIPGIDEIYEIDLAFVCRCLHRDQDGVVDAFEYMEQVVDELKARNFDFCLNMASAGYTAILMKLLEIPDCSGWIADEEGNRLIHSPWSMLFAAFVYHSNRDYNSLNLVDIFRCSAGVTEHPLKLMYDVPVDAREFLPGFLEELELGDDGPLICLQAGASQQKRQWAPAKFAQLCCMLIEQLNARVVLTGAKSEQGIVDALLASYSHPRLKSAVGKTNLAQLAALLEQAEVLITGDTGPMHLAVAVGTPVVAGFLASALCYETGPYSAGNFVIQPQITCNPCNPNFPCSRPDCHDQITPQLMFDLAKLRLETPLGQESELRISPETANPNQAIVYRTAFDRDGFLEFVPMNGESTRNGHPWIYYEAARIAYRAVWKEELGTVPRRDLPLLPLGPALSVLSGVYGGILTGLDELQAKAGHGIALIDELIRVIRDVGSPPRLLGELNAFISVLDRQIEELGLSVPPLGALIRMYIMEKENIRGNDPLILASQVKGLYQALQNRTAKFSHLFRYEVLAHHHRTKMIHAARVSTQSTVALESTVSN